MMTYVALLRRINVGGTAHNWNTLLKLGALVR